MASAQGFVTGSVEFDADYNAGYLSSTGWLYGSDGSLKLYVDPAAGTVTTYDTLGGGVPFGAANRSGNRSWAANSPEALRRLEFLPPGEPATDHPDFQLTYASYGHYRVDSAGRGGDEHLLDTFFYFGIPTAPADLPRMGTGRYRGIADGELYDMEGMYDLQGTATLFADFETGTIETGMLLKALAPGVETDLGVFDGLASLAGHDNAFSGTWVASSAGFEGLLAGSFFGPGASEFGYTFAIRKPDFSAVGGGVVVGAQNPSVPPPPRRHRQHRRRRGPPAARSRSRRNARSTRSPPR